MRVHIVFGNMRTGGRGWWIHGDGRFSNVAFSPGLSPPMSWGGGGGGGGPEAGSSEVLCLVCLTVNGV